jgi:hypothetical protein
MLFGALAVFLFVMTPIGHDMPSVIQHFLQHQNVAGAR